MNKLTLDENAKQDWLKIVKKHRKKQKGAPALTTLNTDAGNVEKHIELFNKMNSSVESPSNNPVSGPFGDSVDASEGTSMGESCNKCIKESTMDKETVELYYSELELDDVFTGEIIRGNYYEPDEYVTYDVTIEYEYEVDKTSVIEFLQDLEEVQDKYWTEDITDDEYDKLLEENFDILLETYYDDVLAYFEDSAREEASKKYNENAWLNESKNTTNVCENLDDSFDMSLRSIL